jgi:hypothetical protein
MNTTNQTNKDAFDQWWEWANKPVDSPLTIPADIHDAVMMLTQEERKNRAVVNETVRTQMSPLRPAGSADRYGVPMAAESEVSPEETPASFSIGTGNKWQYAVVHRGVITCDPERDSPRARTY